MAKPTDTRARILEVARDLFMERGVQQTSLRDIAEQLGLSKPALYHHFDSRDALLETLVRPLLDDLQVFLTEQTASAPHEPSALLGAYFDLLDRHRSLLTLLLRDLSTLGALDLGVRLLEWRRRLIVLLVGPRASLADRVRATVAIGGLSDCIVELPNEPADKVKTLAVQAACAALAVTQLPAKPAAR
jgi:AcrR family transcriptional regulator